MSFGRLALSRHLLKTGVGQTSRRDRTLPADVDAPQIPARVGSGESPIKPIDIFCLLGPLQERAAGQGIPVDQYTLRLWHVRDDLISTDGLFRFPRAPLKKWVTKAGTEALVEMHLSSPETAAAITAPTPGAHQIVESPWESRQWHPPSLAKNVVTAFPSLTFSIRRLKRLALTLDGTPFSWQFSDDGEDVTTGQSPACMNRSGGETGIGSRTYYPSSRLQQASLLLSGRIGLLQMGSPGGFLGPVDATSGPTPVIVMQPTGTDASNLADAAACGQPWHGTMTSAGIATDVGLILPPGYIPPQAYFAPEHTHYVKAPGIAPAPSAAELPATFSASGMRFETDAILFSAAKRYAVDSSWSLGASRWLHISSTGVVSVLRLVRVSTTGLNAATLRIYRDGTLTPTGIVGSSQQIGADLPITSPNPAGPIPGGIPSGGIAPRWKTSPYPGNDYRYVSGQSNSWGTEYPINTSPSGDKALICQHRLWAPDQFLTARFDQILAIYEIEMQDNLSGYTASKIWELDCTTGATVPPQYKIYYSAKMVGERRVYTGPDVAGEYTADDARYYGPVPVYGQWVWREYTQLTFIAKIDHVEITGQIRLPFEFVALATYDNSAQRILTKVRITDQWTDPINYIRYQVEKKTGSSNPYGWYSNNLPITVPGDWITNIVSEGWVNNTLWAPHIAQYPYSTTITIDNPAYAVSKDDVTAILQEHNHVKAYVSNNLSIVKDIKSQYLMVSPKAVVLATSIGFDANNSAARATYNPRTETISVSTNPSLSCT